MFNNFTLLEPNFNKNNKGKGDDDNMGNEKGTSRKSITFLRKVVCLYLYAQTSALYSMRLRVSHGSCS